MIEDKVGELMFSSVGEQEQNNLTSCKFINSLNDQNTINQHQCQVLTKDPEKKRIQLGFEPSDY